MGIYWDYKLENDGISTPFEAVRCHIYYRMYFGLPVFDWQAPERFTMRLYLVGDQSPKA